MSVNRTGALSRTSVSNTLRQAVWRGGDESMQDQDRDRAVDQGRDSRGVFAGKQRPGGPCAAVTKTSQ